LALGQRYPSTRLAKRAVKCTPYLVEPMWSILAKEKLRDTRNSILISFRRLFESIYDDSIPLTSIGFAGFVVFFGPA
jgi:hypothetical protein